MKKFLFLSFVFILVMIKINCQFTCDPHHDCRYAEEGDKVPDPEDCEKYYVCELEASKNIGPSTEPLQCPEGDYFDQTNASCVNETVPGVCTNQCIIIYHCETECPVLFVGYMAIANISDCSFVAICMPDGSAERAQCPEDSPYFNGNECVKDESQCCNWCSPYCNDNFGSIADPCDCTSYYNCDEVGLPYDINKMSCAPGYYFDDNYGWCFNGTCDSFCSCI